MLSEGKNYFRLDMLGCEIVENYQTKHFLMRPNRNRTLKTLSKNIMYLNIEV